MKKKTLLTLSIALFAMTAHAQTALKVHSSGQLSLQSATTSYGIQIPANGVMSIEPNITSAYQTTAQTKAFHPLSRSWMLNMIPSNPNLMPSGTVFYVYGNGNAYAYNYYVIGSSSHGSGGGGETKNLSPITGATELALGMKGYYMKSNEFEGITPDEIENSEEVSPEALAGILNDIERSKTLGLDAEVLDEILPEAVRHDPDGKIGINYNAVVTVLVEAFKEQQAKIEQMENILRENGLLR